MGMDIDHILINNEKVSKKVSKIKCKIMFICNSFLYKV